MASCEVATTVSPTYAREISGQGVVAPHLSKLYGIRNGIDPELWDPEADRFLPTPYGWDTVSQVGAMWRCQVNVDVISLHYVFWIMAG